MKVTFIPGDLDFSKSFRVDEFININNHFGMNITFMLEKEMAKLKRTGV